jgi:hypothetical protein
MYYQGYPSISLCKIFLQIARDFIKPKFDLMRLVNHRFRTSQLGCPWRELSASRRLLWLNCERFEIANDEIRGWGRLGRLNTSPLLLLKFLLPLLKIIIKKKLREKSIKYLYKLIKTVIMSHVIGKIDF